MARSMESDPARHIHLKDDPDINFRIILKSDALHVITVYHMS